MVSQRLRRHWGRGSGCRAAEGGGEAVSRSSGPMLQIYGHQAAAPSGQRQHLLLGDHPALLLRRHRMATGELPEGRQLQPATVAV
ncbi:MAG: hypothetical protein RLZZ11_399 [Cyanobacteriota bacterium]